MSENIETTNKAFSEEKVTKVVQEFKQPITVEVNKTTRGYTWSIKVSVEDEHTALYLIDVLDFELRKRFQASQNQQSQPQTKPTFEVKRSKIEEDVTGL